MFKKFLALTLSFLLVLSGSSMAMAIGEQKEYLDDPMVDVIVQLEDTPVLVYETQLKERGEFSTNSIRTYEQQVHSNRMEVLNSAARKGIDILPKLEYSHSFAGFSTTLPMSQVSKLLQVDGVKAIFPDEIIEVPTLPEESIPGVPVTPNTSDSVEWTNAPYLWDLPEGVTGEGMTIAVIDTGIDWTHPAFGSGEYGLGHKILGGVNFTDSGDGLADFMDVQGHGTHVAGTSSAFPLEVGENTYQGVAPNSNLYGIKTLGDDGSGMSSWTIAGIEWAVNPTGDLERADVINMSLGNSISSPYFPTSLAANAAAEAGVIVVSSAGNSGHDRPTTGSPSTGHQVISVGNYGFISAATVTLEDGTVFSNNINPSIGPDPDGEMYEILNTRFLSSGEWLDLDFEDKIVFAHWDDPWGMAHVNLAAENGAKGFITYRPGTISVGGEFPLPFFGIPGDVAEEILSIHQENPEFKIALDVYDPQFLMAGSSSGGPTTAYTLKPDITAPGSRITAAYPNNGFATLSGTSMAAPHVAGGAALLKQLRPELTVEEMKALLMNTPWHLNDLHGEKYPVTTQGSGIMDLQAAAMSRGIALPGSLSLNVTGADNAITVKNISDENITYDIELISDSFEATFVDQITVEANSEAEFDINFNLDLPHGPHEGYLMLTPTTPIEIDDEEDYYDKLQVTLYYHSGDIEEFFVRDLEFPKQFASDDKIDISFTLNEAVNLVEIDIFDMSGNYLGSPAAAPFGLPAGSWTLHNTDLGLADGEYSMLFYAENRDGLGHILMETFEINSTPAAIGIDADPFVSEDVYTLQGELDREATVEINGITAQALADNGFKLDVELEEGENTFEIVATTPFGVTSKETISIVYVDGVAVFSMDTFYEGLAKTNSEVIFVYDYLPTTGVVHVSVNGGPDQRFDTDENGLVKYTLNLENGLNEIRITKNYDNTIYTYNVSIYKRAVERLAGENRFETAVEISKQGWEQADTVILSRSDDFADSLAAVSLSQKLDAPILLTQTDTVSETTISEIERLGATGVVILGGELAISEDVEQALQDMELDVTRIGGDNRFETASLIAEEVVDGAETVDTVVIAYARNFPDGLSAAPLAANINAPILLVDTDEINEETQAFIEEYDVQNTIVIGGSLAISDEVVEALPNAERVYGANRYATNIAVAERTDSEFTFVASGESFVDALTVAALAAKYNGSLLLVQQDGIHEVTQEYLEEVKDDVLHYFIAGGRVAIGEDVEAALNELLW